MLSYNELLLTLTEFVGHTLEDISMIDQTRTNVPVVEKEVSAEDSNVSFEELMARIRHIVLTNRLRVRTTFRKSLNFNSLLQNK